MDILNLIGCMRKRTPLWNRQSPLYTSRAMKKQLWIEVMALTGATEDEVRRKWKCLNDIFRREHNKYTLRKKQDPEAEPPQWKYYSHMLFLESQIGMRYTRKNATGYLVDMLREEHDDEHSLDSSLDYEDLTNCTDVSIKLEALDDNSLGYDNDDADTVVEEIRTSSPNYQLVTECNLNGGDNDEPPIKRAKRLFNDHQQLIYSNLQQNDSNASQINGPATHSSDDLRIVASIPKSVATLTKNVAASQHVDSTITQHLFSLDERQLDDCKHMLQHVQQQQQQHTHNIDDDDYHFALSLVPTMRGLPTQRKMLLRMKIQQLLYEETALLMNAVSRPTNNF